MKLGEKPTADQIIKAREKYKLTCEEAASLVYMQWRAWRRYENGQRTMHPAFWELWQIKARLKQLEDDSEKQP